MPNLGRPTMHDVARAAGVSHQTVSNVLHGRGRVGAATRERVAAAIEELGYRPHAGAASLRTRRTNRLAHPLAIGELGPMNANTIMLEFIQSLTTAAGRRGQHLVLSGAPDHKLDDVVELFRSGAVDAVVLANVLPRDERVDTLARLNLPFACFGRTDKAYPQTWVDVDSRVGVAELTKHLIRSGHTRISFIGYASFGQWDLDREQGYADAMSDAGLPQHVSIVEQTTVAAAQALAHLLDGPDAPTAIVTGSDVLAGNVYTAAAQRGLRIGSDLAVTGFDASLVGRLLTPSLTTAAIPTDYITDRLIARVLAELDGPTDAPGELVRPDLVFGESA